MTTRLTQKLYTILYHLNSFLILLLAVSALFLSRASDLGWADLANFIEQSKYLSLGLASLLLLWLKPKTTLLFFTFISILVLNAWTSLFQASLPIGQVHQDWTLIGGVSSAYSFQQAMRYVWNLLAFLLPLLVLFSEESVRKRRTVYLIFVILFLALCANAYVIFEQAVHSFSFLSKGSGSAIRVKRPPGLLEDSGASTVVMSMFISGCLGVFLLMRRSLLTRTVAVLFALGFGYVGLYTKGRVYFVSTAAAFVILFFLGILPVLWRRSLGKVLILLGTIICFVLLIVGLYHLIDFQNKVPWFSQLAFKLDRARSVQWLTMWKSWWEHPFLGSGFGTYYSNYFENLSWAQQWGGLKIVDVPTSLYLLVLSEFGLSGLVLILLLLIFFLKACRNNFAADLSYSDQLISCFTLGMFASILVSFLVGLHLIFSSASFLIAFCLAWSLHFGRLGASLWTLRLWQVSTAIMALKVLSNFVTAPERSPEFLWKRSGHPQIPVQWDIPIVVPFEGRWFRSGTELALLNESMKIFIERPADRYPTVLRIAVKDANANETWYSQIEVIAHEQKGPGQTHIIRWPPEVLDKCLPAKGPEHYCSLRFDLAPEWIWNSRPVGIFVSSETLGLASAKP